jgi:dihydrolipoamide dehydrogenase
MKYDIAIIGSGPGGYVAAIKAAQSKKSVALIEKEEIGGTCLNKGCIPTKTLLHTSSFLEKIKEAEKFNISVEKISFDYLQIKKRKDETVETLKKNLKSLLLANKIKIYKGLATFLSEKELKIEGEDNLTIKADNIIIASGSKSKELKELPIDGKYIFDSSSILEIEKLPKTLTIVGGGYIGCEFASLYNQLGVKVTILEAMDSILCNLEKEICNAVFRNFKKRKIEVHTNTFLKRVERKNNKLEIFTEKETFESDMLLIAMGRVPNTDHLGLEKVNISLNERGAIQVNDKMQTNIKGIYAIGDVTGKNMLAHVASHQGVVAVSNILNKETSIKEEAIPAVIFTTPEAASVGLTQKEALAKGYDVKSSTFPLSYLGKAYTDKKTEGFVKIVFEKETKQILGAFMFGENASIMIAEMALAINNELTLDCITETIHTHPTLPEAWFEVASLANDTPIHIIKNL